jgi:multidrug transporter EmrE-like cation transporter
MLPYLLVIFGAIATVAADWFSKTWTVERVPVYFVIATLLYASSGVSFTLSLTMGKLTVLNAFWSVFVFVASTLLGMLVFHESTTLVQKFALGFGFVSILLFSVAEFAGK